MPTRLRWRPRRLNTLVVGFACMLALITAMGLQVRRSRALDSLEDFEQFFKGEGGGFAWVHWAGEAADEERMAKRFETSIRCLPFPDQIPEPARGPGQCILTGQASSQRVVMAKAY